jgi:effector-binding domain-containing protein
MRLHVVDMAGDMDIEVGAIADVTPPGDSRVRRGELPGGRYATLTYVDHAIRANRHLIEWTKDAGLAFDRRATPAGDAFACRYEAYLSDERKEKRKTRWRVQLNFKLAE